jgi:hypothetical protein
VDFSRSIAPEFFTKNTSEAISIIERALKTKNKSLVNVVRQQLGIDCASAFDCRLVKHACLLKACKSQKLIDCIKAAKQMPDVSFDFEPFLLNHLDKTDVL